MRGKLRDKRATQQHDGFKREDLTQRRPQKLNARTLIWSTEQLDDEDDADFELETEENPEAEIELPPNK